MNLFPDQLFSLSTCIFCSRECRNGTTSKCRASVWEDAERKRALSLVSSKGSVNGFHKFFWSTILGSSVDAAASAKEEKVKLCQEDADGILPMCAICLETIAIIKKLHSDLERIQMLLIENIHQIQKTVEKSLNAETQDENVPKSQLEVLCEFQAKILSQSEKSIKIPLLFVERFSNSKPSAFSVVKVEPDETEIQHPCISSPHPATHDVDGDDDWRPLDSPDSSDNTGDDVDYPAPCPTKKRVGRPRKGSKCQKRSVGRPRKDESQKRPRGRPRKDGSQNHSVGNPLSNETENIISSKPQQVESSDKTESSKPKILYRLIKRKNIWRPKTKTGVPDERKKHFHKFYRCELCEKTYCKRTAFLKHKRAHEENEALLSVKAVSLESSDKCPEECKNCSVCHRDVPRSSYYEHLLSHEDEIGMKMNDSGSTKSFACLHKDCIRRFNIEENLKIHMDVDHDEISTAACMLRVKKCDVCSMCYDTSSDLLEHFKRVHKDESRNLFYCQVCAYSYSRSENLIIHMYSHKNKDQQICFICKTVSSNRAELLAHFEQIHDLTTKGECESCSENFDDIYLYHFHLKNVHKRQETFVCSFCGKICLFSFSFMRHLKMHIKVEKRGLRCETCNSAFPNEDKLSNHKIKFHGAPKLQCTHCDSEFTRPSSLSKHMQSHAEGFQFQCKVCGKYFAQKGNLVQHAFVHTEERAFTCEICGFPCKNKSVLSRHMETHDKKFSCHVCGRKFARSHALKTHSKMHTDETIVCPYCGYEFHNRKSWKRHVKAYHESDNPLPLYRPQKRRRACVNWKDSEGNVHYAKNVKPLEGDESLQAQSVGSTTTTTDEPAPPEPMKNEDNMDLQLDL